jgi:hypothetical protein
MTDTSKIVESVVHIKDLPIMNTIDPSARILIEDSQDTKQMTMDKFLNLIESTVDSKMSTNTILIANKIAQMDGYVKKMDDYIKKMNDILSSGNDSEADRNKTFAQMQKEFKELQASYQQISNTWNNQIVPFYNTAVIKETERQSNETYRVQEFQNWSTAQDTMENQEATRQAAEAQRVIAEKKRINAESDRIEAETDRKDAENIRQEYYQKLSSIMKVTDNGITFFP